MQKTWAASLASARNQVLIAVQRTALARGPEPCGDGNLTAVFSSGSILIMARPAV